MVRKLSISPEESDLSLPTATDDREVKDNGPLSSNFPTWSSRLKCLEAYVCFVLSFTTTLDQCRTIGMYGSVVFVVYFIYGVAIGVPIVMLEVWLGRYVMGNVTKAWSMCPMSTGLLLCLFGTTAYASVTKSISAAYLIKYLISFYRGRIEWDQCREPWARNNCYVIRLNGSNCGNCHQNHSSVPCFLPNSESSGTQYWKYVIRNSTDVKTIIFTSTCSLLSIILVVLINLRGYRSCEKILIVLIVLPVLISLCLSFLAYSSLGALKGLMNLLKFKWSYFLNLRMWLCVLEEYITSLGLGTLALSYISSHGKFTDNIYIDVLVVVFTVTVLPSFTAIPISSVFFATEILYTDSPVKEFFSESAKEKMSNVFVRMSEALVLYPEFKAFWSFLFYLQMTVMCIGTQAILNLALCEAAGVYFRNNILCNSITIAIIVFVLGIPYLFYPYEFESCLHTFIVTIILLYAVTLQIFYGFKKFNDDYHFMMGYSPPLFFLRIFWLSIIPLFSIVLGVKLYFNIPHSTPANNVYICVAIPLLVYFFGAVFQIFWAAKRGLKKRSVFMANPEWAPDNPVLKMSRVIFDTRIMTKEFMYRQELCRKPLMKPPDFSKQNIVQLL